VPDLLKDIDSEIRAGLTNERARLDDALFNLEFYNGDFSRFPPKPNAGRRDSLPRTSLVMQRICRTLTANLYKRGPTRKLKPPKGVAAGPYDAATEWLEHCYRCNGADALWQESDRLSCAADVAGFQVRKTPDPAKPVEILLWRANEIVVWVDPDDQKKPIAVATLDLYNHQRRLRLYTAETMTTYMTDQWTQTTLSAGATAYKFVSEKPHDYGEVPFTFVHFNFPTCEFQTPGIGTYLRSVNEGINLGLTLGFDSIRYNLVPILLFKNVAAGFTPKLVQPGDIWDLPGRGDGEDGLAEPGAEYLQADSSFVAASWDDLKSYLDHVLEMVGVPPNTIRMETTGAESGVAIIAEQTPLILWAESRQRPFASYEDHLAKLVLSVGAKHLGKQEYSEYRATATQLEAVAAEPGLVLRWADMYPRIPGQTTDLADQWRLDNRMASRTTLLMEREQLTREEAESKLEEIAEDLIREQELFQAAEPEPDPNANPNAKAPNNPAGGGDGSDDPTAGGAGDDDEEGEIDDGEND
jgi:hypothetical protein